MSKTEGSQGGNNENCSLLGCDTGILLQHYTASQATRQQFYWQSPSHGITRLFCEK